MLETAAGHACDAAREAGWRERIAWAFNALGWASGPVVVRHHAAGTQLAIGAPIDQLFTATSVNEWAWHEVLGLAWSVEPESAPIEGRAAALITLQALAAAERRAEWVALTEAARDHDVPLLFDDDSVSVGSGAGTLNWPLTALPAVADIDWSTLRAIPAALVTGSNGKTTTARLVAAIAREAGLHTGRCDTDGLFVDERCVQAGDYAGPAGARAVLRDARVELAVLETARGGILRRGLALARADAAIVTNVSADHFGEYGIDDLAGVADTKLVVAHAVAGHGLLVLNADDSVLAARAESLIGPLGWFSLDDAHPRLVAHHAKGGAICGVRAGRLRLVMPSLNIDADLGAVDTMPLAFGGSARYNIANLLGAALVAAGLGLPVEAIRSVLARFGAQRSDNPGRLGHWVLADLQVFVDYAHNPEGLAGLLTVAKRSGGRLGLVLGQAGNRADAEIRALAATAASFEPAFVVLKDIESMQRGRVAGEVAAVLRGELLRCGLMADVLGFETAEVDAARRALSLAVAGDTLVLPIHGAAARAEMEVLLDVLKSSGWRAAEGF